MLFKKEFLVGVVWKSNKEVKVLETKTISQTRWTNVHRLIFEYQGKLYETHYETGATEQQEVSPYEYEDDEINCEEVVEKQVMITVYELKNPPVKVKINAKSKVRQKAIMKGISIT